MFDIYLEFISYKIKIFNITFFGNKSEKLYTNKDNCLSNLVVLIFFYIYEILNFNWEELF